VQCCRSRCSARKEPNTGWWSCPTGRPGDHTIPYGLSMADLKSASWSGSNPSLVMSSCRLLLSRSRRTIFSRTGGQNRDAEVHLFVLPTLSLIRPPGANGVRQCPGGHDLEAAGERGLELHRRRHLLVQHAIDAEANPVTSRRFDVDVGSAFWMAESKRWLHSLTTARRRGSLEIVR